ncbi:MAG: T9SS type A sorting domain-containing protein [Ignavibacteriaceae bacterium]
MRLKSSLVVFGIFFFTLRLLAQVPDSGFEQWSGNYPTGWWANDVGGITVTQSTDAHSGSYSAKGETIMVGSNVLQPLLVTGLIGGHGFPVSERYANVVGYYKLFPVGAENLSVVATMFKDGQVMGIAGLQFFAASDYTEFNVPVFYINESTPDSCQISFTIGNNEGPVNVGSIFYVDDISFSGITDVTEETAVVNTFELKQNYPNPFNPSTTISYKVPEAGKVVLKVYDIIGNEVATLVNKEEPAGSYNVQFKTNDLHLSSGTYLYRLQAGSFVETKKMILLK